MHSLDTSKSGCYQKYIQIISFFAWTTILFFFSKDDFKDIQHKLKWAKRETKEFQQSKITKTESIENI